MNLKDLKYNIGDLFKHYSEEINSLNKYTESTIKIIDYVEVKLAGDLSTYAYRIEVIKSTNNNFIGKTPVFSPIAFTESHIKQIKGNNIKRL